MPITSDQLPSLLFSIFLLSVGCRRCARRRHGNDRRVNPSNGWLLIEAFAIVAALDRIIDMVLTSYERGR